ncbi:MAG TPA: transglycosylase domain-containing protein [Bacteroidia bacterium]|jgi:penicillin-binding protein 1A|nr:transglycosylase domain-containing protein [Bacteroidia bacterium]
MTAAKNSPSGNKKYILITWSLIFTPVIFLFLVFSLTAFGVLGELPDVEELQNPKNNLASIIYSSDGRVLGKFYKENRVNCKFSELSPNLVHALVATEDARFYEHSGVDLKALFRSVSGLMTGNMSAGGGSTITQQLAKMQFSEKPKSKVERILQKFKEWIISIKLERLYTKEEIMTMYLNKFDFLNLAVGVKSASQIYFNTSPDKLTLPQAAMLVGMAKNPALYNPRRFEERTQQRRNVVLSQMKKYNYITEAKYDSLKALPLKLDYKSEDHNEGLATYFREYLRDNFLKEWCTTHKKENGKPYDIYRDGLKIYTTIDSRMQQYAEEAATEQMTFLQKKFMQEKKKNFPFAWNVSKDEIKNIMNSSMHRSDRYKGLKASGKSEEEIVKVFNTPVKMRVFSWYGEIDTTLSPYDSIRYYKSFLQCGFMAMEPQSGYIKAWVGGINHEHFKYDHVKVGRRQVGSTFKPFVYALAIQEGYSPCYQIPNVRTCITTEDGKEWCPDNSAGEEKFEGKPQTLKLALAMSINYISAALMKKFGPRAVVNLARRMGVTAPLDPVPALCLGVADISVYEMVGANSTFANQGTYVQPIFVTRIEDKNGKVLEEFVPNTDEVFNEEKAYVMCELMKGVVIYGTGCELRYKYKLNNPIAGKTGTTQNNSDGWFIGMTPDLVAGCWVGGEDRSVHFNTMEYGQGARMALPVWGKFFTKVYADKTIKLSKGDFYRPAHMSEIELDCSKYDKENQSIINDISGEKDPFDQ